MKVSGKIYLYDMRINKMFNGLILEDNFVIHITIRFF